MARSREYNLRELNSIIGGQKQIVAALDRVKLQLENGQTATRKDRELLQRTALVTEKDLTDIEELLDTRRGWMKRLNSNRDQASRLRDAKRERSLGNRIKRLFKRLFK